MIALNIWVLSTSICDIHKIITFNIQNNYIRYVIVSSQIQMREPWLTQYLSDIPKLISEEMGNTKVMVTFLQSSQMLKYTVLLLLLLSRFSHVRLCVTPETAAHQTPPSLGFSRQRTLDWVPISFSNAWKWKVQVKSLSRVGLSATPWTVAHQAFKLCLRLCFPG